MSLSLPPSFRDFQIYQRLMLDGASTRQAAADFSLSQTRIRQIVLRVTLWLAENLQKPTAAEDAAYLRLAQHIAADRLQLLYGEAMHGWRATHESKYAGVILRVTTAMGKMPVTAGTLDALLADVLEGPLPDNVVPSRCEGHEAESTLRPHSPSPFGSQSPTLQFEICNPQSAIPSPPPSEDCSPSTNSEPVETKYNHSSPALTPAPSTSSTNLPPDQCTARRGFLSPAHPSGGTGILPVLSNASWDPTTTAELQITPQTLNLTTQKHSSRRDRRRLRRLAAKP